MRSQTHCHSVYTAVLVVRATLWELVTWKKHTPGSGNYRTRGSNGSAGMLPRARQTWTARPRRSCCNLFMNVQELCYLTQVSLGGCSLAVISIVSGGVWHSGDPVVTHVTTDIAEQEKQEPSTVRKILSRHMKLESW